MTGRASAPRTLHATQTGACTDHSHLSGARTHRQDRDQWRGDCYYDGMHNDRPRKRTDDTTRNTDRGVHRPYPPAGARTHRPDRDQWRGNCYYDVTLHWQQQRQGAQAHRRHYMQHRQGHAPTRPTCWRANAPKNSNWMWKCRRQGRRIMKRSQNQATKSILAARSSKWMRKC